MRREVAEERKCPFLVRLQLGFNPSAHVYIQTKLNRFPLFLGFQLILRTYGHSSAKLSHRNR